MTKSELPARLLARLRAIHDDDAWALVEASLHHPRQTSMRANAQKTTRAAARAALAAEGIAVDDAPMPLDDALVLSDERARDALTKNALVTDGALYVQTLSSMIPPRVLAPSPGDEVLDLAAAPGGKTLVLADLMQNRGRIAAVEPSRDRFFRLRANLARAGVTIADLYMHDGVKIGDKVPERFDRVLLDAPCSTEARFLASDPRTFDDWSEKKVARLARLQERLLASAFRATKPGGRIVYSTCSYAPEENEHVVAACLAQFAGAVRVVPIALSMTHVRDGLTLVDGEPLDAALAGTKRVLPHGAYEASYVALLEKTASTVDDTSRAPRRRR